jgi:hypothetical protein
MCRIGRVARDRTTAHLVRDGLDVFGAAAGHDQLGALAREQQRGGGPIPVPPPLMIATLPSSRMRHSLPYRLIRRGDGPNGEHAAAPAGGPPELEELFRLYDDTMSFVPNSLFTMARRPEILRAFSDLITQIWRPARSVA